MQFIQLENRYSEISPEQIKHWQDIIRMTINTYNFFNGFFLYSLECE